MMCAVMELWQWQSGGVATIPSNQTVWYVDVMYGPFLEQWLDQKVNHALCILVHGAHLEV